MINGHPFRHPQSGGLGGLLCGAMIIAVATVAGLLIQSTAAFAIVDCAGMLTMVAIYLFEKFGLIK